ncbi:hypothetical protein [Nonomuraea sp. NPDC050310]|uniref:hypothetical protein n=1 Tax=Nonomuraea sp. NPDC050310 TaxID=3154935 RepID=UPI0033CB3FF8
MNTVILLGGASGIGKSSVAYPLARRLGVPLVELDDIVEALQAMTTPQQLPMLHYWCTTPEAAAFPAERIVELQIEVARALEPAVRAVVANHLETGTPVVLEGDYLLPSTELPGAVKVILHEPDEDRIVANYLSREPAAGEQRGRARVSRMYGDWLAAQAAEQGVPVVAMRPWADAVERTLRAAGLTA